MRLTIGREGNDPIAVSANRKRFIEQVARTLFAIINDAMYSFPAEVLTQIRNVLLRYFFVRVESPGDVSLFVYDNDTFIVESFRPESTDARISLDQRYTGLQDLITGQELSAQAEGGAPGGGFIGFGTGGGQRTFVPVQLKLHSCRVFSAKQGWR
jgi:hypothetical protein